MGRDRCDQEGADAVMERAASPPQFALSSCDSVSANPTQQRTSVATEAKCAYIVSLLLARG